ncbi:unnamed protein product [Brassicogethes aeneus]|uniref:Zinc finger protein OZF-like n=1 Tax=Brassicogethes aeneus TaxID=1431903 RepID=A0A9P0FIN2_BRAAE|nr:unnamed protein product [Brassicogethes aeneus]
MEEKIVNITCRACLQDEGEFISVFCIEKINGTSLQLAEMIESFSSVKISLGDGFSDQLCKECYNKTLNLFLFKLKCEETDLYLKQIDAQKEPLKEIHDNQVIVVEQKLSQSNSDNILVKPEYYIDNDSSTDNVEVYEEVSAEQECNETEEIEDEESDKNNFACDICFRTFSRMDILLSHKIAHSIKIRGNNVEFSKGEESEELLQNTILIKTEDLLFSCTECNLIFLKKEELDLHLQNHGKRKQHQCEHCLKSFTKPSHLTRHLKTHSADKLYVCNVCKKRFSRLDQLHLHVSSHSGVKPHICEICLKGFNQISNLKDHMRTHNGEKPFLCSECGKGFNQLGNLRQHTIRHTGIKSHLCSTCGNGFASKGELSAHLRKHTGARPFVCPECNRGFTTSSSLTKHKRIHSGEKPYECDVCKMKFSRSGILARHKRTHTGEKPYVCKFCGKAFSQSNDLTSHLRIHTGEKPYVCDMCGQAFRQSSALKTHKRTHEEKIDYEKSTITSFVTF